MHKGLGEYRLAARYQGALAINPQMPEALVNLGETLYLREAYADSIQALACRTGWEAGPTLFC
ncbi:MAG: hypothetical protein V2A79_13340 [Planctomycetota bacterium]